MSIKLDFFEVVVNFDNKYLLILNCRIIVEIFSNLLI